MEGEKNTEEKIARLQLLEQNIHTLLVQKQTFQNQLFEVDNAISELQKTNEKVFKIVGNIMVSAKKEEITKELEEKKEVLALRIKSIDKQEENIKEESKKIQGDVMREMNKK